MFHGFLSVIQDKHFFTDCSFGSRLIHNFKNKTAVSQLTNFLLHCSSEQQKVSQLLKVSQVCSKKLVNCEAAVEFLKLCISFELTPTFAFYCLE